MIYLDYNATTPLHPEVRAAMMPHLGDEFGNPSSAHRLGARARVAVETARVQVAAAVAAGASEIVFTSGGTEASNLAIQGAAASREGAIVTTPIEHSSVLQPIAALKHAGRRVRELRVDGAGRIDVDDLRRCLSEPVALVSIGWANNEIGTIAPVAEVSALCRAAGVLLHIDAVQAFGKIAVAVAPADLMSLSGHKIGGPKGVGALWVRGGVRIEPRLLGGPQERGLRAGTENVAGIVGFGAACQLAASGVAAGETIAGLRERLWQRLAASVGGLSRNSPPVGCLPNTLNVRVAAMRGEALVAALDLEGVAVSTGSACAAGAAEVSHVLRAIGIAEDDARDGLRFSLGRGTTSAEIERAAELVAMCVARIRAVRGREAAHA